MASFLVARLRRLTLVVLFGLVSACGGGGGGDADTPPATTGATVSGQVVSSSTGLPLADVAVTSGARATRTAADGSYTLEGVTPGTPAVLKFTLAAHANGFASVDVADGGKAGANVRLTPVAQVRSFDPAASATLTVQGSTAAVELPPASLVVADTGAAAAGTVTVELTPIDPAADPGNMPGNFQARTTAGAATTIESFGALSVELRDAAGRKLNLAAGQSATIRIPLATRSADRPPTIPLFHFNETTGLWQEEGVATLRGVAPDQYYEGTVTHFSTWNADRPAETIFIEGCVEDLAGRRVADVLVQTVGIDYAGEASVLSRADGSFTIAMRRGGVASLFGELGSRITNVLQIGPRTSNLTLTECLKLGDAGSAPQIVRQPQSETVPFGQGTYLVVQAIGSQPLSYQWRRNGVNVANGRGSALFLSDLRDADNGARFTVVVSNALGQSTSSEAVITVGPAQAATINQDPLDQTVLDGATATFSVNASSQGGTLSYQWLRNGQPIDGATAPDYTTPVLTLADDGALYSVRIDSSFGATVTSATARLTVTQPVAPSITRAPQAVTVNVGQPASFDVIATGVPEPSYQWLRNDEPITGATSASYTLTAAALADNGAVFSVRVSNTQGSQTSEGATLTVNNPTGGAGYYLLSPAGPFVAATETYANGVQTTSRQALLAVREGGVAAGAITVEPAGASEIVEFLVEASFSGTRASNARSRFWFYTKQGRFYKVDQVVTSGAPVPQLVSSLTTSQICGSSGSPDRVNAVEGNDIANAALSWVFLRAPGADSQCGTPDDAFRALRLDMDGATAARTIGQPLAVIRNASGAFAGLIVRNGSQIQRLDANLGSPVDLFTVDAAAFSNLFAGGVFGGNLPGMWLFLEGNSLYGVNLATPATRTLLDTLSDTETVKEDVVGAGNDAFVVINGVDTGRLLRITNGTGIEPLATLDAQVQRIALTPSRVVLLLASTPARLVSVPRAGGTLQAVHTQAAGEFSGIFYTAGENVYLSKGTLVGSFPSYRLLIVGADGSAPETIANSTLVGQVGPTVFDTARGLEEVYALFVVDNVGANGSLAGASMRAVEGATRNTLTQFGSFPAGSGFTSAFAASLAPLQYGQTGLIYYSGVIGQGAGSDLFYFDSDVAGLTRVTNFIGTTDGQGAISPSTRRKLVALPTARRSQR